MTKKRNARIAALLLAALLSMFLLPPAVFADGGDYYAYELPPGEGNPDISADDPEETEITEEPADESPFGDFSLEDLFGGLLSAFTPDGNMTLVDDFSFLTEDENGNTAGKQFLTVQSKAGNTFFIVIDRAGSTENVYFLNMVDEADLLALMDEPPSEKTAPVCTCETHCAVGHIDTSCPVCAADMTACLGTDPIPEPEPEEVVIPPEPEPEPETPIVNGMENTLRIVGAVGLLAVAAVVLLIVFRGKNRKPKPREREEEMIFQPYTEEQGQEPESGDEA